MQEELKAQLIEWERIYNAPIYFEEDPIRFPRLFRDRGARPEDIEIAAIFAAHFAWGRRSMIVRDCERLFDHMEWKPYEYVMSGLYRDDDASIHRTVKWSDVASICRRLKAFYSAHNSMQCLDPQSIRIQIYGQKEDPCAANKKINMMRRWMVRRDGKVDLGLWKDIPTGSLIIPLDIHVYNQAFELGLTGRKSKDLKTAMEITDSFKEIWPDDPVRGDFALFGYGITHNA